MARVRPHTWRTPKTLRRGHLRPSSRPGSVPRPGLKRRKADDRLLAPLRRHWLWTAIGLLVALVAAGTRFATIGIVPPSIKSKEFAHATASTELVLGQGWSLNATAPDQYGIVLSPRAYALADMVASPEVAQYVAQAAGLPTSKIGILGPLWSELWRTQQWATGPKRSSQILIENDPYHITLSVEANAPPWPPVFDVATQGPSSEAAARLATAVATGLRAYVLHLQTTTGVPKPARYDISQVVPVSVSPARTSDLANVAVFTFVAVFVLWSAAVIALSSLMRDLREIAVSKVGDGLDRSSNDGPLLAGTD